jgi:DHA2 family multidrug resistance protein
LHQHSTGTFRPLRLGEYLDSFNAAANSFLARGQAFFLQQTADPVAAQRLALQELENLRHALFEICSFSDGFFSRAGHCRPPIRFKPSAEKSCCG